MTPHESFAKTTLVLETGENLDFLAAKLNQVLADNHPPFMKIVLASPPGQKPKILARFPDFLKKFDWVEVHSLRQDLLPLIPTPFVAYLPANAPYSPPPLEDLDRWGQIDLFLRPWIPPVTLKDTEWARLVYMDFGWVSTPALFQHLEMESSLSLRNLEMVFQKAGLSLSYFSAPT